MLRSVPTMFMLWLCSVGLCAPRLDIARDPLRCPVIGQVEGSDLLVLEHHPKMLPGMELRLVKAEEIIGRLQVTEVTDESALARLIEGELATPVAQLFAAPLPFQITAIDGQDFHIYGSPVLQPEDLLTITKEGRPIAVGRFQDHYPRRLALVRLASDEQVQTGNWCYLGVLAGALDLPLFNQPQPPAPRPLPTEPTQAAVTPVVSEGTAETASREPSDPDQPKLTEATAGTGTLKLNSGIKRPDTSPDGPNFVVRPSDDETIRFMAPYESLLIDPSISEPSTPTVYGLTGLIRTPTADTIGDDAMRLTYTEPPERVSPSFGGRTTYSFNVEIHPGIEFGFAVGEKQLKRDMSVNAKFRVVDAKPGSPAIAVGVVDAGRNDQNATGFVVATQKMPGDRLSLTLGGAVGARSGVLGGLSYRMGSVLELQGEYDTDRFNYGVAARLARGLWVRAADLDVGTVYTASYELPLTDSQRRSRILDDVGPSQLEPQEALKTIQRELSDLGMEDVGVALQEQPDGQQLVVSYENRRFTLNELDGLAAALPIAAKFAPASVSAIELRIKRLGITTASITTSADVYRGYARGQTSGEDFARQLKTSLLPRRRARKHTVAATGATRPSYGHADLMLGLGLDAQLATEATMLSLGWWLRPELVVPIGRGLQADVRWAYPIAGPLVRDERNRFNTQRAVLAYAFQPVNGYLAQVVAGRFPTEREGFIVEVAKPHGSRGMFRGVWGDLDNKRAGAVQGPYYTVEYTRVLPGSDTQLRFVSGRFLDNDRGFGLDVTRRFGETQVGLGLRSTGIAERAEMRIVMPLTSRRQAKAPSTIRLRTADRFEYNVRSSLASINYVYLAELTANELLIGPDLIQGFLNQNRLVSDYVRARLR